jgi:hypothetical protein
MQPLLISHSPDLLKLWEAGYDMEIKGGQYLLVHQIPYVSETKKVLYGSIVCVLTLSTPNRVGTPPNHTVFFVGEKPCNSDGVPLNAIINNSNTQILTDGVVINHYFSSRPVTGDYPDYYEKIRTYAEILSVEAKIIDSSITCKPINRAA